ncbi:unnamed protein product [Hymenolepis diminuta]|uniref:Uncharacterized protein n=1 Tax=Hymenolepis diminuta TaxID=6216 RepID=A0A564YDL8_HYMDI|nr:unnamed protein product [Hymenolepis diminuta]
MYPHDDWLMESSVPKIVPYYSHTDIILFLVIRDHFGSMITLLLEHFIQTDFFYSVKINSRDLKIAGWEVWLKQKVQSEYNFRYFEEKGINPRCSYKEGYAVITC